MAALSMLIWTKLLPSSCSYAAERQPSAAAGSRSAAEAGGSQLQGIVRQGPSTDVSLLVTRREPHRQPTLTRLAPASGRHAQKVGDDLRLRVAHLDAAHNRHYRK